MPAPPSSSTPQPARAPALPAVLVAPVLVALVSSGALVLLAQGGWPGQTGTNALEFCETLRPGLVKQPINTFSNAGFVLVSLLVGWRALRDRTALGTNARLSSNRMTATTFYPAFYAAVAAFLGPGSAALHATTTRWGGRIDVFSMYLWIVWVCVFAWIRLRDGTRSDFLRLYLPAMVGLGVLHFAGWIPISSDILFGAFVVLLAGLELAVRLHRPELRSDLRSVAGATACFLLAFAIWIPSRTGGPLCEPDSLVQGHAIWHLLCAGSVWLLYCYLRSESLRSENGIDLAGEP